MSLQVHWSHASHRDHLLPIQEAAADWDGPDVSLVASVRDLRRHPGSVYMEHGCGLQWHRRDNLAEIAGAPLIMVPNQFLADRYLEADVDTEIIGTPKMDRLIEIPIANGPVAISFHWISILRSAILRDYRPAIAQLAQQVPVIGHGHPRVWARLEPYWRSLHIEPVEIFEEVLERASVYICDHSSTLYEWAATGRSVVLMDYPGQQTFPDRSSGLRYSEFADIGPHALPATLVSTVRDVLTDDVFGPARKEATDALFPYLGVSVPRTLEVLHGATVRRS